MLVKLAKAVALILISIPLYKSLFRKNKLDYLKQTLPTYLFILIMFIFIILFIAIILGY